jgi:hypothetical protein
MFVDFDATPKRLPFAYLHIYGWLDFIRLAHILSSKVAISFHFK